MLLSRFWYVVLAFAFGAAVFILYVATGMYNRAGNRAMAESLASDSSAVDWYLKDDARRRSSALIRIALNPDLRSNLQKISGEAKVPRELADKTRSALKKLADEVVPESKFDALWAVDNGGRVIAGVGVIEPAEDWELGGYPVVADALHGWIRDDAWVWKGRIYRVVARPIEVEANGEPVGAIVGAKIVDDAFANAVSKRTGAAVGFYAEDVRVASWAPEGFDKANLDQITQDLKDVENDKDYQEKGRSAVRPLGQHLGVVYARLPGEAWELGAGYAVARLAVAVDSPLDFMSRADDKDKSAAPTKLIVPLVLLLALAGLAFTWFEHTQPLKTFRVEAERLAKGQVDVLAPSKFRGGYKKIASDLNDGIEKAAAKGGGTRRAADLESVLGPIPAQPAMSAFSVPGADAPSSDRDRPSFPKPPPSQRGAPRLRGPAATPATPAPAPQAGVSTPGVDITDISGAGPAPAPAAPAGGPPRPPPPRKPGVPNAAVTAASAVAPSAAAAALGDDEMADWRKTYEEFLAVKKQCGEPTQSLTFEKFQGTLQRNKDALVQRHGCSRVKFTVYVKEGKAALKASPVK